MSRARSAFVLIGSTCLGLACSGIDEGGPTAPSDPAAGPPATAAVSTVGFDWRGYK